MSACFIRTLLKEQLKAVWVILATYVTRGQASSKQKFRST